MWGQIGRVTAIVAVCLATGGCFQVLIGGVSLSQISTIATVVSIATTGKGPSEHGLDLITGMDCRILDSLMREEREICEERHSPVTQDDFRGVFAWLEDQTADPKPTKPVVAPTERQIADGPVGKVARFAGLSERIEPRSAEPPTMLAELQAQPPAPRAPSELAVAGRESPPSIAASLGLTQTAAVATILEAQDEQGADVSYLDVVAPLRVAQAATAGGVDLGLRLNTLPAGPARQIAASNAPILATGLPRRD
jgi:hypothetical protein